MEEVIARFSHLSENIFDALDNESMANSAKVNKFWNNFVKKPMNIREKEAKSIQIEKIKETVVQFHTVGKAWDEVFNTASTKCHYQSPIGRANHYVLGLEATSQNNQIIRSITPK